MIIHYLLLGLLDGRSVQGKKLAVEWLYGDFFPFLHATLHAVTSAWRSMGACKKKVVWVQVEKRQIVARKSSSWKILRASQNFTFYEGFGTLSS
jgi:hypothetical protein